jgi:HEPN domain-containing protein
MLTKEQHIRFWVDSANEDWETASILLDGKRYGFCLFSLHLVIEKILKALWLKESVTNTPPFTHDLVRLAEETGIELNPEQIDFLSVINSWNIRGRYPDFTKSLHHNATPDYVHTQLKKVSDLKEWLEQKI